MLHNYHTHTFRNHHTIGTEREYIESAIKNGFRTLGFSEHAPYRFPDGYISYFHMFPEDLENYIQTLLALKAEYAGRIEILIGYEAEFYPRFFDDFLRRITQYPVDYLLLGQHYIHNEIDGAYVYEPTDDPKILKAYVDQCIAGLDTGLYTYLAHPDLINFTGAETLYRKEMERLCLAAKERNIPLELNLLGLRANRTYFGTLLPYCESLRQHDCGWYRCARPKLLLSAGLVCAVSSTSFGMRACHNRQYHAPPRPQIIVSIGIYFVSVQKLEKI